MPQPRDNSSFGVVSLGFDRSARLGHVSELRVVELASGRELAWREFGTRDGGAPVVALHGSPGSHRNFEPVAEAASRSGVRLIAVDRPGYGHSTFDPTRSYRSFAVDVSQLADHLGLGEFGVAGWSSGGPNAAGCARFLDGRVNVCAIISGPAPSDAKVSAQGGSRINQTLKRFEVMAPRIAGVVFQTALRQAQRDPAKSFEWLARSLPACDAAVVGQIHVRSHLLADLARPVSSTAGRAAVHDIRLEAQPWSFALEEIACPVHVWHGDADATVTVANGIYQADTIPGATLHHFPGEGHWLLYEHFDEILEALHK